MIARFLVLIDTNVWSELARSRPEPIVLSFLAEHDRELVLSTIVLAEMEFGIAKAPDPVRRERLASLRRDIITRCESRILTPDEATAAIWGTLKAKLEAAGKPIADMDLLIASQAIATGMPLATRNLSDMERTGATIVNPWQAWPPAFPNNRTPPPAR